MAERSEALEQRLVAVGADQLVLQQVCEPARRAAALEVIAVGVGAERHLADPFRDQR